MGFGVSGFELRNLGFGFRVSVFGFRVSGFGFQVSGFRTDARSTEDTIGRKLGRFGSVSTSSGIPDFAQKFVGEKCVYQYWGGGAGVEGGGWLVVGQ